MAVNIEISTPMISTSAKPLTTDVPKYHRMKAVMSVDTFESKIEFQARPKPASMAAFSDLPARSSSLRALEDEDVGVDRHAHREHEARDAGERQGHRDRPEQRVVDDGVEHQRDARDDARAAGSWRA